MASSKLSAGMLLATLGLFGCRDKPPTDDAGEHSDAPIAAEDAPQVLAERLCAQMLECECGFIDAADCEALVSAALSERIDVVLDAGGSWDAECAGKFSKAVADWECLGPDMAAWQGVFDPRICPMLRGTVPSGQECSYSVLGDDCAAGSSCFSGTCTPGVTLPVPIGQNCETDWESLPCEPGSYCNWTEGGQRKCEVLPSEGDSCSGDVCGPSGNLICDAGTCVLAPGEAEECFYGYLCGPGLYCDGGQEFTCQPRREIGDGCGGDAVCPVDASCVGNICEADPARVCSALNGLF
jgi:hypothetical protein